MRDGHMYQGMSLLFQSIELIRKLGSKVDELEAAFAGMVSTYAGIDSGAADTV